MFLAKNKLKELHSVALNVSLELNCQSKYFSIIFLAPWSNRSKQIFKFNLLLIFTLMIISVDEHIAF